jgi:hypothetical protein
MNENSVDSRAQPFDISMFLAYVHYTGFFAQLSLFLKRPIDEQNINEGIAEILEMNDNEEIVNFISSRYFFLKDAITIKTQ